MAKIYRVKMASIITFDLKADEKAQAQRWIDTHTQEDVIAATNRYEWDGTADILYEYSSDYDDEDIDISTEVEE